MIVIFLWDMVSEKPLGQRLDGKAGQLRDFFQFLKFF